MVVLIHVGMQHMCNIFVDLLGREPHDYSYLGLAIVADFGRFML